MNNTNTNPAALLTPPVYSSPSHARAGAEEAAGEELSVDRLICSNPNCVSHEHAEGARFQVTVEVDAYGGLLTDLDSVESYHFTCCDCGDEATTKRAQAPVAEHAEEAAPDGDSIKHAKRIEKKLDEHFAGKRELDLHDVEQMAEDAWARSNAANDLAEMRAWEVVEDKCCDVFREIGISNAEFAIDQASNYDSPDRAIHAHEQNVFDTTSGCRVAQDIAFEAFHKVINQMNQEGGA